MQALANAEAGGKAPALTAADWSWWAERLRVQRYDLDDARLKPYYEVNHVLLDGVFYAATRLYGVTFRERHDLPVYDPTVRVFDVFDRDGSPLAIFIADYYARPNKSGGAWMSVYVGNDEMTGDRPVVANHLNIARPPAGEPTLLTQDEVVTAFHEFGHALHGMFAHVKYPHLASVPRDFVEYPSQFNEMWAVEPEVLRHFALHWKTGERMPQALVDKVLSTQTYGQAYATTEYIAATLLDLAWHEITPAQAPDAAGVPAFEADALHEARVDFPLVPPRYRSTYFSHIFSGSIAYSAGYYSYLWSEVLADDSADWVRRHGGLTRQNGDWYRATVLSRGGSEDTLGEFRKFYGGEPDVGPLLAKRGLAAPKSPG
jgi:peptidyl-dipeptidase Dcp